MLMPGVDLESLKMLTEIIEFHIRVPIRHVSTDNRIVESDLLHFC